MRNVLSTLKIGFDLDGVLAHTDEASIRWYQDRGLVGSHVSAQDITNWNHPECLGVDESDMIRMFNAPEFFEGIKPDRVACDVLRDLKLNGAEIHIVTSRAIQSQTSEWLARSNVKYDRLEFTSSDLKPGYAEWERLDFFFEDHPETALHLASKIGRISFLRDKPYNQGAGYHKNLIRFYSWREIERFFRL